MGESPGAARTERAGEDRPEFKSGTRKRWTGGACDGACGWMVGLACLLECPKPMLRHTRSLSEYSHGAGARSTSTAEHEAASPHTNAHPNESLQTAHPPWSRGTPISTRLTTGQHTRPGAGPGGSSACSPTISSPNSTTNITCTTRLYKTSRRSITTSARLVPRR